MATLSAGGPNSDRTPFLFIAAHQTSDVRKRKSYRRWAFVVAALVFSSLALAQAAPQITGVDPDTGKVNDTVTVNGSNLGKASVSSVYLSDDKNDYKATIVDQGDDKITMKVPQVKPGEYSVSIQVGDKLFIKPVKFHVQE